MIRIAIDRASDGTIRSFTMKGHARFDDLGRDIVCAGASAVTFGTLNAMEELLGVIPETAADEKDGYVKAVLSERIPADKRHDVQLLLESMLVMLRSIEQSYGKHIRIQDVSGKGG
jgi:uncharacterized protein YsxB (DUF464 family)